MDVFGIPFPFLMGATTVVVCLLIVWRFRMAWRSHKAKSRSRMASRGEEWAAEILQDAGYQILEHQKSFKYQIFVDNSPMEFLLRFDFVVAKDGKTMLVEVKTGDVAPSLSTAATRRQLLEYAMAYGQNEILLVDVWAESIQHIQFHLPSAPLIENKLFNFHQSHSSSHHDEEFWLDI